ncbi:hypothetical protein KC345_g10768, partial [Hortaea werneckii]
QAYVANSMHIYTVTLDKNANDKLGFKLQFNNDIHSAYRIVYKTKIADRQYANETITNTATYATYSDDAQYTINQLILNKKDVAAADVNYASKTVTWTVKVNEDSRTMTNLVLTDTFGNGGLQLVGTPAITPDPSSDNVDYVITDVGGSRDFAAGDGFKVQFLDPITKPYTITYTTNFDYYMRDDSTKMFPNTASVTWSEKTTSGTQESTKTFTPRPEVINNGLKSGTYDAISKQITWSVGANYNKKVLLAGAELVDTLPAGQKMAGGTTVTVAVYKLNYASNGNPTQGVLVDASNYAASISSDSQLKVKFLTDINYAFYVVFNTEFSDEDVDLTTVTNTAILNDSQNNPVTNPLVGEATVPKGGEYVSKSGSQDSSDQTLMNWKVTINANQSVVSKVEVLDTPSTNQVLLPASFQLLLAAVAGDGTISETATTLAPENYTLEFFTDVNGKESFKLTFKNTFDNAYILKYKSVITAVGDNVSVNNAVSFRGESTKKVIKDITSENSVNIVDTGGTGSGVTGSLKVLKTNADQSVNLAGAEFSLYRLVGTTLSDKKTGVSNTSGGMEFTGLRAGKYILKETKAPAGYALDATEHTVTINSATPVQLTVTNDFNGSLNVTKVAQEDPAKRLAGAEFELYDSTNTLVKSGTTDASGNLTFTKLMGGNYTLKEIKAPAGYKLSTTTSYAFTIDPAQEKVMIINNVKEIIGCLKLTKVDEGNSSKKLAGAEFTLYDSSKQVVKTGVTDENGELEFKDLKEGIYTLKETGAPAGYELNPTDFPVNINSADPQILSITNKEILGSIKLVKVDQDDVTKKLAGAEFKLYDAEQNVIRTGTTDTAGELEFNNLNVGSYVLKETSAPAGYDLSSTEYPITIDSKVQQVLDRIKNKETLGSLKIVKVEQDNETKKLAGAEFKLYDAAQHVTKTGITNEAGELVFNDLKLGSYVLKETSAPAGYELNAAEYPVTINSKVQQVLDPITNKAIIGSLKLVKVDQDDETKKLAGAEFKLYDAEQNVVKTGTTDAAGELEFNNLRVGSYVLKEASAPVGYVLSTTEYPVNIDSKIQQVLDPIKNKVVTIPPVAVPTPTASPTVSPTSTVAPSPSATATPGATATPAPVPTPGSSAPAVSSAPATPQATAVTTTQDIPIEGEIPLGGIPSIGVEPAHGTVVVTPDGKWTYTPDPGYTGKDKFTITVTDEDGNDQDVVIEVDVDEVPKGTVTDPTSAADDGGLPGKLPKTGEESPLPLYLMGGGLVGLGIILARRFKTRK